MIELNCSNDKFGKYKSINSVTAIDHCGQTMGVPSFNRHILILRYSPDKDVDVTKEEEIEPAPKSTAEANGLLLLLLLWLPLLLPPLAALIFEGDKKLLGDNPPAALSFKFVLVFTKLVDDFQYVSNFEVSSKFPENG